ncbi:MAG: macro domain-containing protein, partial [Candidatus Desulfobacillus denitrificans]
RHCFRLAREHGIRSLAFPAISCGVFAYPPDAAARIAAAECRQALADNPGLERVLLVAFDASMAAVLQQAAAVS